MRYFFGLICVFALAIVPLVGCSSSEVPGGGAAGTDGMAGTGGGQAEFTRFAYVASSRDDRVSAYAVDELTGGLHLLGTVAAGTFPWSVTVDPSGQFAYVANQLSDNLSQYRIEANGTLNALARDNVAAGGARLSLVTVGGFQ